MYSMQHFIVGRHPSRLLRWREHWGLVGNVVEAARSDKLLGIITDTRFDRG
ncbi:MAG: hypothetical protein ACJAXA_003333, partial [Candidatus Aldehydirespiratoraceae bacterium]